MIEFEEILVQQASPDSRVVWWSFKPTNDALTGLSVDVWRSYSPTDGFEKIATVTYPLNYYVDPEVNLKDFWREAYYKLAFTTQGRTVESTARGLHSVASVPAREMIRLMSIDLRFSGMPALVYLMRKGARCPDCWDPHLQKVTRSSCQSCYTTGYLGGYYSPVLTLVNIVPEDRTKQVDSTQQEHTRTTMKMAGFPQVRPKDLIRETNNGIIWRVENIAQSELERIVVVQEINATKLETTDIEHKLPIPEGLQYLIKPHWASIIRVQQNSITRDKAVNPVERVNIWR